MSKQNELAQLADAVTVDGSNVGIGTSSPSATLTASQSSNNIFALERTGISGSSGQFGINIESNSQTTVSYDDGAQLVFGTASSPSTHVGFTERMRLDASGNVGIGTSSPNDKFHVDGAGAFVRVNRTDGEAGITLMYNGSSSTRSNIATQTNGDLAIDTANAERMRIDASGRVTMPYQPYFFAHRTGSNYNETASTAKVLINGTRFNNGGHFDTTNNRFVAPLAGAYQFNASVNCYGIADGNQFRVFLRVNGTTYAIGDSFHSGSSAHDIVASISHVIYLSANDYVEVWSFSDDASRGFSQSPIWNTFSGHLIG